jgi:hypothetical protein
VPINFSNCEARSYFRTALIQATPVRSVRAARARLWRGCARPGKIRSEENAKLEAKARERDIMPPVRGLCISGIIAKLLLGFRESEARTLMGGEA